MKSFNPFWEKKSDDSVYIKHYEYIEFLEGLGFYRMTDKESNHGIIVRVQNNIVRLSSESEIINATKEFLSLKGENTVLEIFTKQVSSLTSIGKLALLKTIPILNHADNKSTTWLYFKNTAIKITAGSIDWVAYEKLDHLIWEESLINHELQVDDGNTSMFEELCYNVSNQDNSRFKALKTNIGYLISRFNDPSNPKAVIFLDEEMDLKGFANGGTGKSLISLGLSKVRTTVFIDGKKYNPKYIFGNQRVGINTDIIWYDDVRDNFSLEDIYSMLTSGVEVHKKFKSPIYIPPSEAPKILICSNYVVKGTGGNTDKRRRCEFELHAYYNTSHQPIDDFGKLFYSEWDSVDYNRFHWTMIKFAQTYLAKGLIIANPINLAANRLITMTSEIFVKFVEGHIDLNMKLDKRAKLAEFNGLVSGKDELSSHQFTKWLKTYAIEKDLVYGDKSSGGDYLFWLYEKNQTKSDDANIDNGKEE